MFLGTSYTSNHKDKAFRVTPFVFVDVSFSCGRQACRSEAVTKAKTVSCKRSSGCTYLNFQLICSQPKDIEYPDQIVTIQGIDMMADFLARSFGSTPDILTTIEDETCNTGIYAATWTMDGYLNDVSYSARACRSQNSAPEKRGCIIKNYCTEGDIMINIPGLDIVRGSGLITSAPWIPRSIALFRAGHGRRCLRGRVDQDRLLTYNLFPRTFHPVVRNSNQLKKEAYRHEPGGIDP